MNKDHFIWNDKLLQVLDLNDNKFTIKDIEKAFLKKYKKNGRFMLPNSVLVELRMPGFSKLNLNGYIHHSSRTVRISYVMSWVCKNFIIDNDRPKTKYFSSDFDFEFLDNNQLSSILNTI